MTIIESRLTKHDFEVAPDGTSYDIEIDVDFTGPYDPIAAKNLNELTPSGFSDPMSISVGAEIGEDSGVRIKKRNGKMINLALEGATGLFTIYLSATDALGNLEENPLERKDVIIYRRNGEAVQISRDRTGRVIATYRNPSEVESYYDPQASAKPIEIFSELPTVQGARYTATITGYREDYKMAFDTYDPDGPSSDDPTKQQEYTIVNDAPLDLDGITWPIGTVAFLSASAQRLIVNGISCIQHTWELAFKPSWNLRVLNSGYYEWDASQPSGQELQRIKDPTTNTFRTSPWPLDDDGKALAVGFAVSDLVYVGFTISRPGDFTYFGFAF